ncbi:Uncharacterised protein [Mycobacterium tuberculosis]|nr:Uncharacterised protein [Mycobacterium tuberculosis]CNU73008.1 Uncharacterised protein [Mycobacterium tuberculosis]COW51244.1 Uncharacterised protein [Mycobacterium tuberculosis]
MIAGQHANQFTAQPATYKPEFIAGRVIMQPQDGIRKDSFDKIHMPDTPHDQPGRHQDIYPSAFVSELSVFHEDFCTAQCRLVGTANAFDSKAL